LGNDICNITVVTISSVTPCGDSANNQQGLDAMEFPDGLSSAVVMLDWYNLEFKGGFVCVERLKQLRRACCWPHQNPHCKQMYKVPDYCDL